MKTLLAGTLLLSFSMTSNSAQIADEAKQPIDATRVSVEMDTTAYGCCWVFYNGVWYCIPCG